MGKNKSFEEKRKEVHELVTLMRLLEDAYWEESRAGNDIAEDLKLSLDRIYDKYLEVMDFIHPE